MTGEQAVARFVVGIDTGGTFNDFVLLDSATGRLRTGKVPSTPRAPDRALERGLRLLALGQERVETGVDGDRTRIVVGTTVAINAILERRGPRVVYVTNRGFTDVLFIGRLDKQRLYDLHWERPPPLVRRRDCVGVRGRVGHDGRVEEPLDLDSFDAALAEVIRTPGEDDPVPVAVAVCTLFSYLDPSHEIALTQRVRERLPGAAVSVSHEVSPVWREYERASTTVADAFVKPAVESYVAGVSATVAETALGARWHVLASNGGQLSFQAATRRPSQVLLSGLAGGVVGAQFFAARAGVATFFSLDMGGTSCDIGLVIDGTVDHRAEFEASWGIPVTVPCVGVETIGAGGGSIAWIDKGGLLHVGPRSAGADPGPAAYGLGGSDATVTDANVVLGRLNGEHLLGGQMSLDADAAAEAVRRVGEPLGLDGIEASLAVVRTTDENMANAIRLIAVERGVDPRDFVLVAFGGAGPLHAREVASRLGIRTVLVPPHPGLCGAIGAMIASPRVDAVRTYYARDAHIDLDDLAGAERALSEQALGEIDDVGAAPVALRRYAAMRYEGQNYELEVEFPEGDVGRENWEQLLASFAREHEQKFGFALPGEPVELVSLRITVTAEPTRLALESPQGSSRARAVRKVWFGHSPVERCPVYERSELGTGARLEGPAVIEEVDSTTLLFPGDVAVVGPMGSLLVETGAAS